MAHEIDHFPGRQLYLNNENYYYFGGTSYLGLQTDQVFQELFISNIKKYGTNYGASRKSNVQLDIFRKTEAYLSKIVGSEACISLSSGYLAGQLIAKHFNTSDYSRFYTPNTHCALFTDKSVCFENYSKLNTAVRNSLERDTNTTPVIFLDSIDFSGANYPNFTSLQELPLENVILVVDDSHGIGIVGAHGGGVFQQIAQLRPKELIVSSSLGKGFGIQAGALFGTKKRLFELTETDFFGGASPASPAAMATLFQAESIYENKRVTLQDNINLFKKEVDDISNYSCMKGHPAFSFSNSKLTSYLEKNRILITSFNYPTEDASVMSRIVISAAHTTADITYLSEQVNVFFESYTS